MNVVPLGIVNSEITLKAEGWGSEIADRYSKQRDQESAHSGPGEWNGQRTPGWSRLSDIRLEAPHLSSQGGAGDPVPAMKKKAVETVSQCIIKTAVSAASITDCVKPPKTTWRTRL